MDNPYLLLTLIVFVFITALFWGAKLTSQKQKIMNLNIRAPDSQPILLEAEKNIKPVSQKDSQIEYPKTQIKKSNEKNEARRVKELCIYFNYNDHSWEAHEVLGVPVGSQIPDVTQAYQNSLKVNSSSSHDFLEVAYMSILKKRKEHL